MDRIINLIKYDTFVVKKTLIFLIIWFFVFGAYLSLTARDLFFLPLSIMQWATFIAGLPFVYGEKSDTKILLHTFPIDRKTIVRSRYAYALASGFVCLSMTEIIICILAGFFNVYLNMTVVGFALCLSFLIFCIMIAIQLPLYFKYLFKAAVLLAPMFIYILSIVLYQVFHSSIVRFDYISKLWSYPAASVVITLLLCSVMMLISYLVSCRFYIKKDV